MKKRNIHWHAALIFLAADFCLAADEIVCPDKVRLESAQVMAADVPEGYLPFVSDSLIRLSGPSIFDGPVEDGAALKPVFSPRPGILKWEFEGAYEYGKWVSCDYGDGIARLVKRLPDAITSCTATVGRARPHNTTTVKFECR